MFSVGTGLANVNETLTLTLAATPGSMINTTTPSLYDLFRAKDTTGTNAEPSTLIANGSSLKLGHDAASPVAQTIITAGPRGGTDSNVAGVTTTIAGSPGTGTGDGGSLVFGKSVVGSTGTSTNPTVTTITIATDAQVAATPATTIAGRLRVADGTAALPSIVFTSDDDSGGTGFYRPAANFIGLSANGVESFRVTGTVANTGPSVSLGLGGLSSPLVVLFAESTQILQQGNDSATASAQTFKGPDGSGTDKVGGAMTISAGGGTGTALGGALVNKTSITNTTGSTIQGFGTRRYVYAGDKELTAATATGVIKITLAAKKFIGVKVFSTTHADDNTDFQATTEVFTVSAVAKGTTISSNVSTLGTTSTVASSVSTLTTSWDVLDNGDNTFTLRNTAVSSLTEVRLKTSWQIEINSDDVATVTPL